MFSFECDHPHFNRFSLLTVTTWKAVLHMRNIMQKRNDNARRRWTPAITIYIVYIDITPLRAGLVSVSLLHGVAYMQHTEIGGLGALIDCGNFFIIFPVFWSARLTRYDFFLFQFRKKILFMQLRVNRLSTFQLMSCDSSKGILPNLR